MENPKNLYAYPTEWQNYGDVNPERHGGIFVKWDRDMWEVIETRHYADIHDSVSENQHMFEHMWIEPMDIWVNGNPYNGFTDRMLSGLDSFSNLPFVVFNPENADKHMPDNETYEGYVNHYLEDEWNRLIGYVVHVMTQYADSDPLNFDEDYWGYLEKYGIEKENF
jgi:hypothetical protein